MKTFIPFSLLCAALTYSAQAKGAADGTPELPSDAPKDKVQIAILLDTSNSMDGLIGQAKTQLWKVVNTFMTAKRDGKVPYVEVALYEYGNNNLNVANNWIRLVQPLTRDLDAVSRDLFAFRTNGGDEYCGAVIQRSLADLSWDPSPRTYKAIFIAGNEPFTQGPVDARQACRDAHSKGIIVNTIHCGSREEGIAGAWHDGPALAEGKFLSINQDKAIANIDAPQDKEIAALGIDLNKTYLGYGAQAAAGIANQVAQDNNALANAASGAAASRAACKASGNYYNGTWDLVDACRDGTKKLADVPADQLPEAMKKMTPAEREAHLAKMTAERAALQKKIADLNVAREAFVAEALKKQAEATGEQTLDQVVVSTVRGQASAVGYSFGE